jgi:hypothetical protein
MPKINDLIPGAGLVHHAGSMDDWAWGGSALKRRSGNDSGESNARDEFSDGLLCSSHGEKNVGRPGFRAEA